MWKGCVAKADYETPLDYPKIFLCGDHYDEHRRLANKSQHSKVMRVSHSSFSNIQRKRYLKERYW